MKDTLSKVLGVLGRSLITQWHIKFICLLVAGGLWFYVQRSKISTVTINAPVAYLNKSPDLVFRTSPPHFVKVVIRGREEFLKFPVSNIKAEVDLRNAMAGEKKYSVLFDERQLPERTEIMEIPPTLNIHLQRSLRKTLPIKLQLSGTPENGYRIGRPGITPDKITIEGAESVISGLREISTEIVSIAGARATITVKVNVELPEGVTLGEKEKIEVSIPIYAKDSVAETAIEGVPIRVLNLDSALKASLSDKTVKVYIQGDTKAIRKISASDFIATVNLEDTRYNQQTGSVLPYDTETGVPVKLKTAVKSGKISILSYTPEKISVRFEVKPEFGKKPEEDSNEEN